MVYKVPFVNYPEHYRRIWNKIIDAISEALSKGDLILRGQLRQFADKRFDVVFTDAVLIYISPDEIKQVVKEMLRIGRVIVLNEWH